MIGDPEVVRLTVAFIYLLGAAQPLMAVEFALGGALRGAGDTRFPLLDDVRRADRRPARCWPALFTWLGLLGRVDLRRAARGLHAQGGAARESLPQ